MSIDAENLTSLAFSANFQIEKLAVMLKRTIEEDGFEEATAYAGVLARIILLTNVVFHAAKLSGADHDEHHDNTLGDLQRMFDGTAN